MESSAETGWFALEARSVREVLVVCVQGDWRDEHRRFLFDTGDGELGRGRVVHPQSPKAPEKYSLCVFKVTVETNTDGLSPAQDALRFLILTIAKMCFKTVEVLQSHLAVEQAAVQGNHDALRHAKLAQHAALCRTAGRARLVPGAGVPGAAQPKGLRRCFAARPSENAHGDLGASVLILWDTGAAVQAESLPSVRNAVSTRCTASSRAGLLSTGSHWTWRVKGTMHKSFRR